MIAKLLTSKCHLIPGKSADMVASFLLTSSGKLRVTELVFEVPKDYSETSAGTIQVFARSVTRNEASAAGVLTEDERLKKAQKPWFVYLQGGPGCGCPAPQNMYLTNIVIDKGKEFHGHL
jgi:hypothetical protein